MREQHGRGGLVRLGPDIVGFPGTDRPRLPQEPEPHGALAQGLGGGQRAVGEDVHARRGEEDVEEEAEVDHGVHVCVQQAALGHAADDAPQPRALHALLGQREHHARVHRHAGAGEVGRGGQRLLERRRPHAALLGLADPVRDGAGAPRDRRKVLPEEGIWAGMMSALILTMTGDDSTDRCAACSLGR